jgi:hypothetical protein
MDAWYNMENCPAYTMVTGKEKKILVYKTEYMHANLLVHYLKTLP